MRKWSVFQNTVTYRLHFNGFDGSGGSNGSAGSNGSSGSAGSNGSSGSTGSAGQKLWRLQCYGSFGCCKGC